MSCLSEGHREENLSILASVRDWTSSVPARRFQNPSTLPDTETVSPIRVNALATRWCGVATILASCSFAWLNSTLWLTAL